MMKKLSILTVLTIITVTVFAQRQEFRKFKFGTSFGYTIPADGGGGLAVAFEPAYRISDELAVGLRIESAAAAKNLDEDGSEQAEVSFTGSYTLNGIYYFSNEDFRPFAGLGLGWFIPGKVEASSGENGEPAAGIDPDGVFGFYPRVGFDYKHFNFMIEYNIISKTEGEFEVTTTQGGQSVTTSSEVEIKNSYLAIKLGFFIGGGRK